MRQEIIADKQGQENKVINHAFQVIDESTDGSQSVLETEEFQVEILPKERQVQQIEANGFGVGNDFSLAASGTERDLFSEQTKVGVVRAETEHDQVGIQAIDDVASIGVVGGL